MQIKRLISRVENNMEPINESETQIKESETSKVDLPIITNQHQSHRQQLIDIQVNSTDDKDEA